MSLGINKQAQSTLEYAVIIAVIVAALISMQVYIKRSMQGRLREAADEMGSQFSPGISNTYYSTNTFIYSNETVESGDQPTTTTKSRQLTNRSMTENVAEFSQEYFP